MHHDRTETHESGGANKKIQETMTAARIGPPGTTMTALFSTIGITTLISLVAGVCYYYTLRHRAAYLGKLGLDPAMLPISMQEAIATGFEGIVGNVLWVLILLVVITWGGIALSLGGSYALQKLVQKLGISLKARTPPSAVIKLSRNTGFQIILFAPLVAIGAITAGGEGALLVGGPAEAAGIREADALLKRVKSTDQRCARYELKGGNALTGWRIGSTADRQFVLGNDNAAHVIKLDDLYRLIETSVPCQTPTVPDGKRPQSRRKPV